MELSVQIYSLIVSFVFGGIFSLEIKYFYKLYLILIPVLKFLISLLFVIVNAIIYFWLLYLINNGILHLYFFVAMFLGYYIFFRLFTIWFTQMRKK